MPARPPGDLQLRAYRQAADYLILDTTEAGVYAVQSRNGACYTTTARSCTCPDFTHRRRACKHMALIGFLQSEREEPQGRR